MTTREELDARLAEFDRRREAADARVEAVLAGWDETGGPASCPAPLEDLGARPTGRMARWRSRSR